MVVVAGQLNLYCVCRVPDHVHVVHRGVLPAGVLPRPLMMPVQRRRIHLLDPRTALNLVTAHESRRRRGYKRPPPPYRGPPRPGPPRPPRWKGPPKRKSNGRHRDKPWMQVGFSQQTRPALPYASETLNARMFSTVQDGDHGLGRSGGNNAMQNYNVETKLVTRGVHKSALNRVIQITVNRII